jgi:hypothetical protein
MRDDRKQRLIERYESKKGSKGCYMHLLSYYNKKILEMHSEGITTFMIQEFILDDLEYFLTDDKDDMAFSRAIRSFIKSKKPKEQPRKRGVLIQKETPDRSELLSEDNTSGEAKQLFVKKTNN